MKHRKIKCVALVIAVLFLLYFNKNTIMTIVITTSIKLSANTAIHTYEDDGLLIYYSADEENTMQRLRQALPAIEEQQQTWFSDLNVNSKLPVFILNKEHPMYNQFFKKSSKGIYYIDLELIVLDSETYSPANNFVHEYAHFLLDQYLEQHEISESLLPIWFLEGFANSFEWFVTNEASESIAQYEPRPFSQLTELTTDNHTEVYSQGFHAVLHIAHKTGHENILTLMQKTKEHNNFRIAFNEVMHMDYDHYHFNFVYDRAKLRYYHLLAQNQPQRFLIEVNAFLKEKPAVHPLKADLVELLYRTHDGLGNEAESIYYAHQLSGLTRNAYFLLELANAFGENEPHLKQNCIEKALFYGQKTNVDQDFIIREATEAMRNG